MSVSKQVSFIEKISNSKLGIEGMQIVVYSDRARTYDENIIEEQYNFTDIANKMIKEVNGELIKQKYETLEGEQFGRKLHEERVTWLKNNI